MQTKTRNMTEGQILPTKILVRKFEKPDKVTKSGLLILKDIDKDPNISGDVILCGLGTPLVEMSVKCGDRVLFNPHSFQKVRIDEDDLLLLDIRDVLFFFKPEPVV